MIMTVPPQTLRVKVEKENLCKMPGGQKIGEVQKENTDLKVIRTDKRWVEMEIVGKDFKGAGFTVTF